MEQSTGSARERIRRREISAAAFLVLFGLAFAIYAVALLPIGSFASMGPGMFPLLTGIVIAGLGLIHGAATLSAPRDRPLEQGTGVPEHIQWHSLIVVLLAMTVFSAVVGFFGLVPAIIALTAVASLASDRLTPRLTAIVAVCLALMAWLVFVLMLGLPFTLFDWSF